MPPSPSAGVAELVAFMRTDVSGWNSWRAATQHAALDMRGADLAGAELPQVNLDGVDLSYANLRGANIAGGSVARARFIEAQMDGADVRAPSNDRADFTRANLKGCRFDGDFFIGAESFRGAVLDGASFAGTQTYFRPVWMFDDASLDGIDFSDCKWRRVTFKNVSMRGAKLVRAAFDQVDFIDVVFDGSDLSGAALVGCTFGGSRLWSPGFKPASLNGTDLRNHDLSGADLSGCSLRGAQFDGARLQGANLSDTDATSAHFTRADLSDATLHRARFDRAVLEDCTLARAQLENVRAESANCRRVDMSAARLVGASLGFADLAGATLAGADLTDANMDGCKLSEADLRDSTLHRTSFQSADLHETNVAGADFNGTNLRFARLINCNVDNSRFIDCDVFGIAVWRMKGRPSVEQNLQLSERPGGITVDSIAVAQFIDLLIENPGLRRVIDAVTTRVVLLLGRFDKDGLAVLQALRDRLRVKGFVPLIFDFERPQTRDLTETISLLAHLSRFVIADLTSPRSVPHELAMVVPTLRIPFQPIIHASQSPYGMFEDLPKYTWVRPVLRYENLESLLTSLEPALLEIEADSAPSTGAT
jgi:uncharacterized protein YjbI with pentapeptide repeats